MQRQTPRCDGRSGLTRDFLVSFDDSHYGADLQTFFALTGFALFISGVTWLVVKGR